MRAVLSPSVLLSTRGTARGRPGCPQCQVPIKDGLRCHCGRGVVYHARPVRSALPIGQRSDDAAPPDEAPYTAGVVWSKEWME